ncbi:hypothetical protein D0T92_01575 [Neisseria zalophi]|uniref:Uncharacterized protein n=1 Tax=Neisseria zalophi TaxID=640030 RepID=A0A5J6Q1N0_9NEIS|nr:hypothetical protein D0T92_01575 [Neisseria zalophi]
MRFALGFPAQGNRRYGHGVSFFQVCSGAMSLTCRAASAMFAAAVWFRPSESFRRPEGKFSQFV